VIPIARNREPYVTGFNRWSRPPGRRALDRWAEQHPRANIAVVPGLSGVMVADVDDAGDVPAVEDLFSTCIPPRLSDLLPPAEHHRPPPEASRLGAFLYAGRGQLRCSGMKAGR